jgi:hypothetical protein
MVDLHFSWEGFAIYFMFTGELESDFLSIPDSSLSLFVFVNHLTIISIGIGLPREDIKYN